LHAHQWLAAIAIVQRRALLTQAVERVDLLLE
jgi:hypothetical protein